MSNKNPKNQISSSKQASEMGKKGGAKKKGTVSLKSCLKRIFASGEVDPDEYMKALIGHAMTNGNAGIAKLIQEVHDGKEPDKVDINQSGSIDLTAKVTLSEYKKLREKVIKEDDV